MAISTTWDTTFEANPQGSDSPSAGDDAIRERAEATRQRGERDHIWGLSETTSKHGWHREGSARAFVSAAAPTAYSDVDATAIGGDVTIDDGRLWFDSNAQYIPYVHDGGSWVGFLRDTARANIQGILATGTNVAGPIVFPRSSTVTKVSIALGTVPVGSTFIMDINDGAGDTIFSNASARLIVADGDSVAQISGADITGGNLVADASAGYLTIDIDQVGSSTAGADVGVTIEVTLG